MMLFVVTRLNININDETAAALKDRAAEAGTTVTEVVRRAVSLYSFFDDARRDGKVIQLVARDGSVTSVQIV